MANKNTFKHKRSSVPGRIPDTANIAVGEIAINFADRLIYTKNTTGNVIVIAYGSFESVSGNIIPSQNVQFSLGNSTHRFSNIYLSGNTIHLGEGQIKFENGKFNFLDGLGNNAQFNVLTSNIIEFGDTTTGNVFFTNARVYASLTSGNAISFNKITGNITLDASGVTAGHYGNASHYVGLVIDEFGRITSANTIVSTGGGGGGGAQGAVGAQGVQGAQGVIGAQGSQGVIGAQGSQGVIGAQGSQGVIGAQGSQGVQGTTGAQGSQGVQGAAGSELFGIIYAIALG